MGKITVLYQNPICWTWPFTHEHSRSWLLRTLWVEESRPEVGRVATQETLHHQRGQRSSKNQRRNSWQTPKLQSRWSFRTLGLAEVWCEALTAATSCTLKPRLKHRWVFSKALQRITCKSWNWTAGMGWRLSQQLSLPRINATLLGSEPLHMLAGQKGEDSVPATSGPSAFHANGEKIHMPLCLHPNHFREAERKVMKEKVREGKPERREKRKRKGVGKKDGDNMSSQQLV